jgi:hypothetical protein
VVAVLISCDRPPNGWALDKVYEPNDTFPNQRSIHWHRGTARLSLLRYWDWPRNPGGPMAAASERPVEVAGRTVKLTTTNMWEGAAKVVEVLWITGAGHDVKYGVRIVFDRCSPGQINGMLANITIAW